MKKISVSQSVILGATCVFAIAFCEKAASAQDKDPVFSRLRQLPDLGACPSDSAPADPDLKKALTIAVEQARSQAKEVADSVARMKDAGMCSPDTLKQFTESAGRLNDALKDPDICVAARSFAKLSPSATVQTSVAAQASAGLRDKISISTDVLDFGHQSMQTPSDPKPVTVTNGTEDKLTLQLLTSTGQARNFQVSGCQNPVDKGQQCTFNVTFTPYPAKMRENYLALVPSGGAQSFEVLRRELNSKEAAVARAEDLWRVEARCADEPPGKTDPDCPEHRTPPGPVATIAGTQARWADVLEKREEVAQADQSLRSQFNVINLKAVADHWKFPFTRAVVGVDMSAPTSNTLKQSYFVDFNLLAPLKVPFVKKNEDPLENRLWMWLNPRITSLPQATNFSAVSTINETGSFFDTTGKLNDIVHGLDVNGGFEIVLVRPRDGIPWWSEYVNTQARLSTSLIVGAGVSTPFSTNSTEVQSSVTQAICDAFQAPAGQTVSDANGLICGFQAGKAAIKVSPNPDIPGDTGLRSFVDFFTPDRSRFFRRYYTGLRFKSYFFNRDVHSYCKPFERRRGDEGDCDAPYDIFPGIIDLTFGRDEAVTAGHLSGWLFRIEGVYPLPWYQGIHVFGSIYTKLQRNHADQPFGPYTIQKPADGAATDLNTFRFGLHPLDRDYFRVGIGVDLIQVFKKAGQPKKDAPQAPAANK